MNTSDYCIISDYEEVKAATRGTPIQGVRFTVILCSDAEDKKRRILANEQLKQYKAQEDDSK